MPPDHAIILHGYAEGPDKIWIPWLHAELEKRGWRVTAPRLPDPLKPNYRKWMTAARKLASEVDERTVLIGHSLGAVTALRLLGIAKKRAAGTVLVSAPYASLLNVGALVEFFRGAIDWEKLRERAGETRILHAEDDPLVPPDHGERYHEQLGGTHEVFAKGAHFTGKKAPAVLRAALSIAKGKGRRQ